MGVACAAVFFAFKLACLPRRRRLAFLLLWPGMDPRPFDAPGRRDSSGRRVALAGLCGLVAGAGLLLVAVRAPLVAGARPWVAIAGGLAALHLGLFAVLAGAWREIGVPVERVCPSPWLSRSLAEFWSRRWNTAFHFVAREKLFRPIARRLGTGAASAATFLFSGLV